MKIDYTYTNIIDDIISYGYDYQDPNREGVFRKELEQVNIKHLIQEGYPIVTARKTFFKGAVGELLLFLKGKNDIRDYHKYGIKFWDKDTKNYEGKLSKYPISEYKDWVEKNKKLKKSNSNDEPFKHEIQIETDEKIYITKTNEKFIILDTFYKYDKKYKIAKIKFLNGGFEKEIMFTKKEFKNALNPYEKTFLDVGCVGNFKKHNLSNEEHKYIKSVWNGMMNRCYDKKSKSYIRYGGKGVIVCNRWKCYEYFIEDFTKYDNYKNIFKHENKYHLDKDFKGNGYLYSFETCDLIDASVNISGVKEVVFEFENVDTGEIVFSDNPTKFIKEKGLKKSAEHYIYDLFSCKSKICQKWKCNSFSPKKYDMGKIYPVQYQKQLDVFDKFKENPLRTDLIINSWQVEDLENMCLKPCHHSFQILGATDGFVINWSQRSTDFLLGSPINIQFYYLMGILLEFWSGHKFNGVIGNLNKVHLYDNQLTLADKMIKLPTTLYKENVIVTLKLDEVLKDLLFSEFIKQVEPLNFKIHNYDFVLDETVPMLTYNK